MYWSNLINLIRRNQASNAHVTFYRDPKVNSDNMAIFDRCRLRRQPALFEKTGYTEEDHWRDSHVCEAAWFNGEIPMEGFTPKVDKLTDKLIGKPYRGALSTLEMLISVGSLRRTDELREIFARHGRRFPSTT
jgi:hypothetical protein